jgi:Cu2+-exporting ATPase
VGEALIGGSVNVDSPLVMCIEKVGVDTVLSAIVRLLDRAQGEKPQLALLADRIAGGFIAVLLVVAAVVFSAWWSLSDFDTALRITLSVLVVTCPCALSLATPTAIVAATGTLTRMGLLTTSGHALETLARATHIIFDKTGTLTYGRPQVTAVEPIGGLEPQRCLALAAALERGSEHPVGRALVEAANEKSPLTTLFQRGEAATATELHNTPGSGIEGWIDGRRYRIGQPEFVAALSMNFPRPVGEGLRVRDLERDDLDAASTWVALGDERGLLAWFQLSDALRPNAAEAVAALQARGLTVELLSGDRADAVAHVAREVGITAAQGGLSPQDKLDRLQELQRQGATVAMVGDGVNDAPVLAAAQVSLAMGSGTQLAHATADMILLSEKLEHLAAGVDMARRTLVIMRENFAWAIGYNLLALPLAAGGWLTPWMSAIGMSFSSLLVVVNALRLRKS